LKLLGTEQKIFLSFKLTDYADLADFFFQHNLRNLREKIITHFMKPIITATELSEIFHQENLVILDARTGKNARENYLENHIKGARFIDLDKDLAEIGENAAFGGRHPLPKISKFAETLQNLGISEDSHIVVYDLATVEMPQQVVGGCCELLV
jgi:rhodanese-related sulfurtransferase